MITVSSWPKAECENQYLRLYHSALAGYGIRLGPPAVVTDDFLRASAGRIDAVHVQWCPEEIWRCRGAGALARLRGVGGLWRYLRLARSLGIKVVWTLHDAEHHEGSGWVDALGYRVLTSPTTAATWPPPTPASAPRFNPGTAARQRSPSPPPATSRPD